jgi:hypothetical protein
MDRVELFHIGPQKSGTTWIYECLAAHPGIAVPPRDSIHYFDMHFARGPSWYDRHFASAQPGRRRFDPTPSYLRSPWVPRRVAAYNPEARIALCLRHPIDRAFSHYWHEKKKGRLRYDFAEVLRNYDLYASWLETGFYAEHVERWLAHFPREQILVQRFELLGADPREFLRELLAFFGMDEAFEPPVIDRKVNVAGPRHTPFHLGLYAVQRALDAAGLASAARFLRESEHLSGRAEHVRGVPETLRAELLELCEPEIARLERLLDLDLASWRSAPRKAA